MISNSNMIRLSPSPSPQSLLCFYPDVPRIIRRVKFKVPLYREIDKSNVIIVPSLPY